MRSARLMDSRTRWHGFENSVGAASSISIVAQVSGTYGAAEAQTIIENCGNTLILRCSGSENGGTSQFASRLIGEREVVRRQVSRGRDSEFGLMVRGARRSTQVSEQHTVEPALMPPSSSSCRIWRDI